MGNLESAATSGVGAKAIGKEMADPNPVSDSPQLAAYRPFVCEKRSSRY
jgi:hypothetical protein